LFQGVEFLFHVDLENTGVGEFLQFEAQVGLFALLQQLQHAFNRFLNDSVVGLAETHLLLYRGLLHILGVLGELGVAVTLRLPLVRKVHIVFEQLLAHFHRLVRILLQVHPTASESYPFFVGDHDGLVLGLVDVIQQSLTNALFLQLSLGFR